MQTQITALNFEGQNIYVGLDVHLKSWSVTVLTSHITHKTFSQAADAGALYKYLQVHFPGGTYHSAYEAGFCGFWLHYQLIEIGHQQHCYQCGRCADQSKREDAKDRYCRQQEDSPVIAFG